jgi:hypothetical protein
MAMGLEENEWRKMGRERKAQCAVLGRNGPDPEEGLSAHNSSIFEALLGGN